MQMYIIYVVLLYKKNVNNHISNNIYSISYTGLQFIHE